MSEGIFYRQINDEHESMHGFGHIAKRKKSKLKALEKRKHHEPGTLTGRSQKEQMRFTRQNMAYQNKIGRAWND